MGGSAPGGEETDLLARFRASVARGQATSAYVFLGSDLEPTETLSFETLGHSAEAIAQALEGVIHRGDRVLLSFGNDPEAVLLFWGCLLAGGIPVPVPAPEPGSGKEGAARLKGIASDAAVALGMAREGHIENARSQVPGVNWLTLADLLQAQGAPGLQAAQEGPRAVGGIAYLQYTSGSTSAPRGVEITHANVMAQCRAFESSADSGRARGLIWLPWFHDYGLVHGVILPLLLGCTSFVMPTSHFLMRPLRWLEAIDKHQVTHSGAPDFAYLACVRALARSPGWSARLDTLRMATCGAEPVRAGTLDAFLAAFAPHGLRAAALTPSYGLAEAVLAVSVRDATQPLLQIAFDAVRIEHMEVALAASDEPGARVLVGCGAPLPGFDVLIVDPDTAEPCPPEQVGEIWVGGPSVARGYWGQPEASAECFGTWPAGPDRHGGPFLRTGDLGFLYQGQLFVAGRRKDLIILSGRNLYPQDLEQTTEAAHDSIRPGGVMAVSVDSGSRESLVLLVECSRRPSPEMVRDIVDAARSKVAAGHQIEPQDVVLLRAGTLPRTSSGKPQRGAARRMYLQGLLEPLRFAASPPSISVQPLGDDSASGMEDMIKQLWSEVLGVPVVDPDASFFDLGGDSLLATQVVSRLRARMGIEVPIGSLFEAPTVRSFSRQLAEPAKWIPSAMATAAGASMVETEPRQPGATTVLSHSQERMWFMHELASGNSAYHMPLAVRFRGSFDRSAMETAIAKVVARHEVLRTRFRSTSDGVIGEVIEAPAVPLRDVAPWGGLRPSEADLHRYLAEVTLAPFRLDEPPLLRAESIRLGESEVVLLIVMHHIVGDQWSFAELGRELAAHYNAVRLGGHALLAPLPFQYADFAKWHRSWFEGDRFATERSYWLQRLAGLAPLALNEDQPRPRVQNFEGGSVRLPLAPEAITALRGLGVTERASLSMVLMAALMVLLHRHTGQTDIAMGVPIANRHHLPSEHLIGTFVNTLVLRTDLGGDPDFRTVLSRVRDASLDAFAHQDMPFELLVRELGGRAEPGRSPLFNVMFNMVNAPARDCRFDGLEWSRIDFDRHATQFDLTFVADLQFDRSIVIEYATSLFERETVERMGQHLLAIVRGALESPQSRVATIPLMDGTEEERLATWSLGERAPLTHRSVPEWVAQGARSAPHREALVSGSARASHLALDQASNRLARRLREQGAGRGTRIGICLPRSADLVIAMLAVLKSGAAYVPLDPTYPAERIDHQIEDAGLLLLISDSATAPPQGTDGSPRLLLDVERASLSILAEGPLDADGLRDAGADDPAYLIYTSGSTGKPKGVAVPHRAVVNFLASVTKRPGIAETDRLLAVTTASFDIAVLELLAPLGAGGTVVLAGDDEASDGRALARLLDQEDITVLQATPSRWHLLIEGGWTGTPGLKALVGGEPLTHALAGQLAVRCAEVWNLYGPTETTVWSTCWRVPAAPGPTISLGHPFDNTSIVVLDARGQPCPIGVPGEICIGGLGVALGYHRQPELTASRFLDSPDAKWPENRRLYRTGDRGRWRTDGALEHMGRLDDQVKLRGFRVELGEIEANLLTHPSVARAVVSMRHAAPGDPVLVAHVVPVDTMPSRDDFRRHLSRTLPEHMIPGWFVEISSVPLLPNGKTDRRALPWTADRISDTGAPREGPRSPLEHLVWQAWKGALKNDTFGIHDNFFDLGGHSIQAVGVVTRIERTLGRPCALRLLFEHPTVAALAAALDPASGGAVIDLPLTLLQPDGDGPPLFLLAGAEMYRTLAQRLAPAVPVYGVFSRTEIDLLRTPVGAPLPVVSIETLATEYLDLIRAVQPKGPYFLGGFSIGGVIAYAVAQRLQQQGESLGLVVMLDSMRPGRGLGHVLAGVRRRIKMIGRDGLRHLVHVARIYLQQRAQRDQPGGRRNRVYAEAIRSYRASRADLPLLFLQAGDDTSTAPAYGWRSLVPGLTALRVPGRHMNILEPPNVEVLSDHVKVHLGATRPGNPETGKPAPASPGDGAPPSGH